MKRIMELKDCLFAAAAQAGLTEYEVFYTSGKSLSVETLKDEISSFASSLGGGICFRCIVDGKMGSASTECLSSEEMQELVGRAVSNARAIESDDPAILYAGSPRYETVNAPDPTLWSAADIRTIALDLQKALYAESEQVTDGTQSSAWSSEQVYYLCNSHGLELSNRVGVNGAYVGPVVTDGTESEDAGASANGTTPEDFCELPGKAVREALGKIGAGTVPSGSYPLVISGKQMRALLSTFSSIFSAKQVQLGLSLLKGREGEAIAAPIVTISDDPMRPGSPIQTAFDMEGVAAYKKNVVENGVLKTLLYDLATASKAGVSSTANGLRGSYAQDVSIQPYNFCIEPGDATLEELFVEAGNGIYVTELKGLHAGANATTGDFSIESAGFRIENGKLGKAVKTFTIAGNFYELLKSIHRLSDTVDWATPGGFTVYGAPAALILSMSVAGT
jgi:PmbA protein